MTQLAAFWIILFNSFFIGSERVNEQQKLTVTYSAIACTCAQWKIDNSKVNNYIYLEPANKKLLDANQIWDGKALPLKVKVRGNYKSGSGLPKSYENIKGNPKPGKVFLYTYIKVIKQ
jgi:hypothetical protein